MHTINHKQPRHVKLVTPDSLVSEARKMMLDGREIQSPEDQFAVIGFLAANVHSSAMPEGVFLITRLYPELSSVTKEEVEAICVLQLLGEFLQATNGS